MSKESIFIINGQRRKIIGDQYQCVTSITGQTFKLPALDTSLAEEITSLPKDSLADVPTYEIVSFLNAVGQRWKSNEYSRRRTYVRELQKYLGYSEKMANAEADWIALLLCSHVPMLDTLAVELGDRHIMDRWIMREDSEIKAFPKGSVLHLLPGNVPLSAIVSILRSILTKNITIAKMSSEDLFSATHLALSFRDVNEDHPVTRSISILYWRGGLETKAVKSIINAADAVCVWGGKDAIDWAVKHAPVRSEIIKFGPKRSLSILAPGACLDKAADALAHDISVYNQNACFSTLQLFHVGDPSEFITRLTNSLCLYSDSLLPPAVVDNIDIQASQSLSVLEAEFGGDEVYVADDHSWRIIVCEASKVRQHPRGRTLYIHQVNDIESVCEFVDQDVQSISLMPHEASIKIRDKMAIAGVDRIIELGANNVFRVGSSHDGIYPLQRMVRFVANDLPTSHHPKGITLSIEQTAILKEERFLELIP